MSDHATAPVTRPTSRRTGTLEPVEPVVIDVGGGLAITVTASGGTPGVKAVKNGLERATRLTRKALTAGITDAGDFLKLLAALADADRLVKASRAANDQINVLLGKAAKSETPAAPDSQPGVTSTPRT